MENNNPKNIHGLRMFLYVILDLIKKGEHESCENIENAIGESITEYIFKHYSSSFDGIYNAGNNTCIDEFYKNSTERPDGKETNYECTEDDGLYLLVKLVLNKLH